MFIVERRINLRDDNQQYLLPSQGSGLIQVSQQLYQDIRKRVVSQINPILKRVDTERFIRSSRFSPAALVHKNQKIVLSILLNSIHQNDVLLALHFPFWGEAEKIERFLDDYFSDLLTDQKIRGKAIFMSVKLPYEPHLIKVGSNGDAQNSYITPKEAEEIRARYEIF